MFHLQNRAEQSPLKKGKSNARKKTETDQPTLQEADCAGGYVKQVKVYQCENCGDLYHRPGPLCASCSKPSPSSQESECRHSWAALEGHPESAACVYCEVKRSALTTSHAQGEDESKYLIRESEYDALVRERDELASQRDILATRATDYGKRIDELTQALKAAEAWRGRMTKFIADMLRIEWTSPKDEEEFKSRFCSAQQLYIRDTEALKDPEVK